MQQSFTPAVSCLLIPLNQNNQISETPPLEIFLSTSDDYALGKLYRTGTDAVYGITFTGSREYDPVRVRAGLKVIDEPLLPFCASHVQSFLRNNRGKSLRVRQGHGNIGMNNWAVAAIADQNGQITQMIVPAGEPIHERIYRSFIKRGQNPSYEIADVMYFYRNRDKRTTYNGTYVDGQINTNPAQPDREMLNNQVFLPVWEPGNKTAFVKNLRDRRIDTSASKLKFVKVARNDLGTIAASFLSNIVVAKVTETLPGMYKVTEKITNPQFVFFGIPVHKLGGNVTSSSTELAKIVHYFYDLRHIFDLGSLPPKEFYLFEHALKTDIPALKTVIYKKTDIYEQAYDAIANTRNAVTINLTDLFALCRSNSATADVIAALNGVLANQTPFATSLIDKGYRNVSPSTTLPSNIGEFRFDATSSGLEMKVCPRRNVYPYSFIGIIEVDEHKKYLLLAVTSGMNGVRSGANIFTRPPFTAGYTLEESVRAIENELKKLYGTSFESFLDSPSNQLLLLDQGGDVHQWIGVGGVNTLVGSSQDRAKLSAELIVTI